MINFKYECCMSLWFVALLFEEYFSRLVFISVWFDRYNCADSLDRTNVASFFMSVQVQVLNLDQVC